MVFFVLVTLACPNKEMKESLGQRPDTSSGGTLLLMNTCCCNAPPPPIQASYVNKHGERGLFDKDVGTLANSIPQSPAV